MMQNPRPLPLSQRCRALAERCRTRARAFRTEDSRAQMLRLATDYDQLALELEVSPQIAAGQCGLTDSSETPAQGEPAIVPGDFDE